MTDDTAAGSIIVRDGGASGSILLDYDTPGGKITENYLFPGLGISFRNGLHVTLDGVLSVNVVYGKVS